MGKLSKRDWTLLLLYQKPLDRIRLMKALFLIWHRLGRSLPGFYKFTPYMYGPCSFELYTELDALQRGHLIAQAPHPVTRWAPYFLTAAGASEGLAVQNAVSRETVALVKAIAEEVASLGFHALLQRVYSEAPDFALRTVVPWRLNE